jgi:MoxR-like ATPase
LIRCAQALAIFDGVDFVTPDHIQELVQPVIAHRLVLDVNARYSGTSASLVLERILAEVPVPR